MSTGLFSRPCSYAVRAMVFLASQPPGKMFAGEEIAAKESIPPAFLSKVLLPLCRDRLLRSRKGLRGGYELLVSPDHIALLDIVRSVDGDPLRDCLLEDRACSASAPCELHDSWNAMREQLKNYLQSVTVADLARVRRSRDAALGRKSARESSEPAMRMRRGE